MPGKAAHLTQAKHNEEFFGTIDPYLFPDWALTVLFYVALHYIDAKLSEINIHPDQHRSRDGQVANHPILGTIFDEYRRMKDDSFNARYNPPCRKSPAEVSISRTLYLARIKAVAA